MSPLLLILITAVVTGLACLLIVIFTRARGTPYLELDIDSLPKIEDALPMLAGLTESAVYDGNSGRLFQNGAVFPAMLADIAAASKSVHLETFVWTEGQLETQFVDALCERARAGVKVRVLRDALGGSKASKGALERLTASGARLSCYCEPKWWNIGRFNNRTHRKLLILDGRIGYTFGHGVSDQWLGDGEDPDHWRDTAIRLEGPVVHGMQAVFSQNWVEESRTLPVDPECFPRLEEAGPSPAHVVSSASGDAVSSVAMLYTIAIACAHKEVLIQNPYFAPNPGVVELLGMMVKRGIQVHLMVPGKHTDSPFVRRAGSHLYADLLEAGVRLYEFDRTLIHQKVVVIDGQWSHIGSTNFDARSLALNEEIGVGILDEKIAGELKSAFKADLGSCRELKLDQWRRRPLYDRAFDRFAYLLHDQL
ncbi:MAG: phospholipase D-like domain-containing protein [Gammaproteobacteria bacterium]